MQKGENYIEHGRSMLEVVFVIALMGLLSWQAIAVYQGRVNRHKADEIYSEILLEASARFSCGTKRTKFGIADVRYRSLKEGIFSIEEDCSSDLFFVKVNGVNTEICKLLMNKQWEKVTLSKIFYRSAQWEKLCFSNSLHLNHGHLMISEYDCSKIEEGMFAVGFALDSNNPPSI